MTTTTLELALLCVMSSHEEKEILKALKDATDQTGHQKHLKRKKSLNKHGWKPFSTSEKLQINAHGYFGVAYLKPNLITGTAEIVFAHRGTFFDEKRMGNVLADLGIALKQKPAILEEAAFLYVDKIFKSLTYNKSTGKFYYGNLEITKITHTGFSLGGFIAGACAALHDKKFDNTYAVTFDAPGIGALTFDKQHKAARIINYVTIPNVVNTCNEQIGEVRMMIAYSELFAMQQDHELTAAFEVNFQKFRLLNQDNLLAAPSLRDVLASHNLDKLITNIGLATGGEPAYKSVYRWPVASNEPIYALEEPQLLTLGSNPTVADAIDLTVCMLGAIAAHNNGLPILTLVKSIWQHTNIDDKGGLVGLHHARDNLVFYTQYEHDTFMLVASFVGILINSASKGKTNKTGSGPDLSHNPASASKVQTKKQNSASLVAGSLTKHVFAPPPSAVSTKKPSKKTSSSASTAAELSASNQTKKDADYISPRNHGPN